MNNNEPRIKFYSFESQKIDFSKIDFPKGLDLDKPVTVSKDFNNALKTVIQKDIELLSNNLNKIVKEIIKKLAINEIILDEKLTGDLENVDGIINQLEKIISDVIIKKGSIKIGVFSTNKKEKKGKIQGLEECISFLSKCQNDIISIKNEYIKLKDRDNSLSYVGVEENKPDTEEDPLERTISFYMKKQEQN